MADTSIPPTTSEFQASSSPRHPKITIDSHRSVQNAAFVPLVRYIAENGRVVISDVVGMLSDEVVATIIGVLMDQVGREIMRLVEEDVARRRDPGDA